MSRISGGARGRRVLAATLTGALVALGAMTHLAAPAAAAPATVAGTFSPTVPDRILDTRSGVGLPNNRPATVPAGGEISFVVAGEGEVPADAGAAVLNVTVVTPAAAGYVTAYPTGATRPATSSVNFGAGRTTANAVTAELGTDGRVTLANGSTRPVNVLADVTGWYAGGEATAAGAFDAVTPARLLDTRHGVGQPNGRPAVVPAGGSLDLGVAGVGEIPADASAAVLNVTATRQGATGYVAVNPTGGAAPTTSSLNFARGTTVGNAVTVQIGEGGQVTLTNGATAQVDLIVDVVGYFIGGEVSTGGAFTPVDPTRLLDTRNRVGVPTRTTVPAGGQIDVQVTSESGVVPTGAAAAVFNVTVTGASASGYVSAYPAGTPRPGASTINFQANRTIANQATVGLSEDGKITLYNGSTRPVHLIADVGGWYSPVETGPTLVSGDKPAGWETNVLDITPDAQWVLYSAYPSGNTAPASLHLFNTADGTTTLITEPADGTVDAPGSVGVDFASVSDDGQFVAFDTDAADLVVDDTNGVRDVFVRDVAAGVTSRVTADDGTELAFEATTPVISGDGTSVAYASDGAVAVWGVAARTSTPVGEDFSFVTAPSINGDGQFVSYAAEDADGPAGVFVEDLSDGTATLVSAEGVAGTLATQLDADGDTVAWSQNSPDDDFSYVAFVSEVGGSPQRISEEVPLDEEDVFPTSISADGTRVGLYATDYPDGEPVSVAFVFDRATSAFLELEGSGAGFAVLSGDGRKAAFTAADALTEDDTDEAIDVYLVDVP